MTSGCGPHRDKDAGWRALWTLPSVEDCFFLDAPPGYRHPRNARYSWADGSMLFGRRPTSVLRIDAHEASDNPLERLSSFLDEFERSDAAIAVGYIAYDFGGYCEPVAASKRPVDPLPLVYLAAYDEYFTLDGESGQPRRQTRALFPNTRPADESLLKGDLPRDGAAFTAQAITGDFTREGYMAAVKAAQDYILRGDIYEVNLSQRFRAPFRGDPLGLYLRLRECNPSPYAAYLRIPGASILSCSPELFLRVEGERVITRPIKGTARRSPVAREDDAIARALKTSEKDNAELAMIIDLERNDLGRVCRYGSVRVSQAQRVETFARVHHLVSTIEGRLRSGVSLGDLLAATFPGGSITGAPKIRAMQIIDELEPCRRGIYTGSIGYILPGRRAEFNIAIRTVVCHGGSLQVQVGGAVTSDSDPEAEYLETLAKAEAILHALGTEELVRREVETRRNAR